MNDSHNLVPTALRINNFPFINDLRHINVIGGFLILSLFLLSGCSSLLLTEQEQEPDLFFDIANNWYIPDGPVQELRERTWDLHHQKLWVEFDFSNQSVLGKTELFFTSKMRQETLVLDAKTMRFDSIYDALSEVHFSFKQDSALVTIELEDAFEKGDTLVVGIRFESTPPERGLYFVNPHGTDPVKPTQIWTLGQPEDNSFWFPTIDHPSERMTQEVWITVPVRFLTLSNGLLHRSDVLPGDSLRTDYWTLGQPHAPYLLALAVGEYEIIEEIRNGILYRYYVEPDYAPYVHLIYKNTVDMIRFSENVTGMAYPWDPIYSQAPVHNYIARGMENTTATILYDAVQFDNIGAIDRCNQDLLLHEIIHQWFGNVITAKDWANLPLNEGFANYYEAQYRLEKSGRDDYLWKNHENRVRYFQEAEVYRRPVIFNQYSEPEDMYDRHTYQKAGQILRMLHSYIGDDAWQQAIDLWFKNFSFKSVDIHDLQSVFEDATGETLDWFFTQWFHEPGHPSLAISYEYNEQEAFVTLTQIQDTTHQPVFKFHPEIKIQFEDGSQLSERITISTQEETFQFSFDKPVVDILIDPDRIILAEYYEIIDDLSVIISRTKNTNLLTRIEAAGMLANELADDKAKEALLHLATSDAFWGTRHLVLGFLRDQMDLLSDEEILFLVEHALSDTRSEIKIMSMELLTGLDIQLFEDIILEYLARFMDKKSYYVTSHSLIVYSQLFPKSAPDVLNDYMDMDSYQNRIKEAVVDALIISDNPRSWDMLLEISSVTGDLPYTIKALEFLSTRVNDMDITLESSFINLVFNRVNDPVYHYRLWAYDAIRSNEWVQAVPLLRERMESEFIEPQETKWIQQTIRELEYVLEINSDS